MLYITNFVLYFISFSSALLQCGGLAIVDKQVSVDDGPFPYNNIRLPSTILPLEYGVFLHPNITNGKFDYTGWVNIKIKVVQETNLIVLHSVKLKHVLTYVFTKQQHVGVKETLFHEKNQQAIIVLDRNLTLGKVYNFYIAFEGVLNNGLMGFYRSSYKTLKGETKYLATTQFEATGARMAFPCFDEPSLKAYFKITIVREKQHMSISNMPLKSTLDRHDGLLHDTFKRSAKMSTYLIAFVVSEFQCLTSQTSRGTKVRVWTPRDQLSQAKYATEITPKILEKYEHFFGINFPLPKLDLIGVPDFGAGAMENWGLITYRLAALLYDPKNTNTASQQKVTWVIAHELAHQWFGDLVTMKWWNDLWLNEGFATFMMAVGTDSIAPQWKMMDQFVTMNNQLALKMDGLEKSHPISVHVKNPDEIGALFDAISYQKGSSVIRMMRGFLGEDNFVKGLSDYLNKHKYGNAESDDLWKALGKYMNQSKFSLADVMHTWTLQMGYPVITVNKSNGIAYLSQERFISDAKKKNMKTSKNLKWTIPLTFYYQNDNKKRKMWFPLTSSHISLDYSKSLGWLKLNADEIGFYRVDYDTQTWKQLAEQLIKNHTVFSTTDRANLLDDAFQLANNGRRTLTLALDMTQYLTKERDYVPFFSAKNCLEHIGELLYSRDGYEIYQKYLIQQILPVVNVVGWNDDGSDLTRMLREIVLKLAVANGEKSSVNKAKELFKTWMEGKAIAPNLRESVYYVGIKHGGQAEWNLMFNRYKSCIVPSEKDLMRRSLTLTSDKNILGNYLNMTLDDKIIKAQDSCHIIEAIAQNPIGQKMAYGFLCDNWGVLLQRYRHHFKELAKIFMAVFGRGKTTDDLKVADRFFKSHDMGGGKLAAENTLESIKSNINWIQTHETEVVSWLKEHTKRAEKD